MIPPEYSGKTPTEISALNTREALDYFWSLPNEGYFSPERTRLFDIVAERMHRIYPTSGSYLIRVIDVGCGPGEMFRAIFRAMPSQLFNLVGFDWAASAIEKAQSKSIPATFTTADLYDLDAYADDWFGEFNFVLCIEALEHQDDWRGAMEQLHRLARPGGHIIITVPNGEIDDWAGHRQFWTLEQLRSDFAQYGLVSAELIKDGTNILAHLRKPNATT